MLLASVIALASFVALILIYFALMKYMESRKKKESSPAPERFPAATNINAAPPEADEPVNMVMDPNEQNEMLENARAMARENPDKAAKLLRGWLHEEK